MRRESGWGKPQVSGHISNLHWSRWSLRDNEERKCHFALPLQEKPVVVGIFRSTPTLIIRFALSLIAALYWTSSHHPSADSQNYNSTKPNSPYPSATANTYPP